MDPIVLRVAARYATSGEPEWVVTRNRGLARIELLMPGVGKVGWLSMGTVSPSFMRGACKANVDELLGELGPRTPVFRVHETELLPEYRSRGYGVEMYRRLLQAVSPAILTTDRCHGGETSPDASRVWRSLGSRYRLLGTGPEDWALAVP